MTNMQRHDETDEVFVLLQGRCILFVGDGKDEAGAIHAVGMVPLTIYNVKQGTWHNHTLTRDASVLGVGNRESSRRRSGNPPAGRGCVRPRGSRCRGFPSWSRRPGCFRRCRLCDGRSTGGDPSR